jgi:hypothetical protein
MHANVVKITLLKSLAAATQIAVNAMNNAYVVIAAPIRIAVR